MGSQIGTMRNLFVDGSSSVGQRMRRRRWGWFLREFPEIESMSVVDLGGTAESWVRAPVRPASVHVVNLSSEPGAAIPAWMRVDYGDACNLPTQISAGSYDIVFSNSVIEHVGGHAQRLKFADSVHKLADRHWVQTPYLYFPIEPHWLFPGFQFLPLALRAEISRRWPLMHTKSTSRVAGLEAALSVELLSRSAMEYYFPESSILAERVAGITKSLVAIRKA